MVLLLLALLSVVSVTAPNFQVRSITVASATDGPTEDEAMEAASVLKEDGVVVIKCSALSTLAPPSENAKDILASMISRVDKCGINHDHPFSFAEICHRAPRRYDVHLGAGLSESEFSMLVNSLVRPVLALLGVGDGSPVNSAPARIVRDGLVTSLPGASAQPFHADGQDGRLFNAFLPLVAVRTQGTEFWLGSHTDELAAQRLKRQGSAVHRGDHPRRRRHRTANLFPNLVPRRRNRSFRLSCHPSWAGARCARGRHQARILPCLCNARRRRRQP